MLLKLNLVEVCNKAYAKGSATEYYGNLSARRNNNTLKILTGFIWLIQSLMLLFW
ncbi:MAG: hypothetical protein AB1432_12420 [Bacteroidota bacterium]